MEFIFTKVIKISISLFSQEKKSVDKILVNENMGGCEIHS